jgi:hypothetical protein
MVIDFYRLVVVQAEGEMDGFLGGNPALEDGILILARTLFEQA